jgi:hypothetical protein
LFVVLPQAVGAVGEKNGEHHAADLVVVGLSAPPEKYGALANQRHIELVRDPHSGKYYLRHPLTDEVVEFLTSPDEEAV